MIEEQVNPILKYSFRNIQREKISRLVILLLLVFAVAVSIVSPMKGKSVIKAMKSYGHRDRVLVMEKDNLKLAFSRVDEELYQFVKTAPCVMLKDNEPLVAPYLQMSSVYGKDFLMLRGITDIFYKVRGQSFKIIEGRRLEDKYDIMLGYLASKRLCERFEVGDFITLENRKWKVVGIFRAKGDPVESGAIVSMSDFREVSARGTYSFIEIRVDDAGNIPRLTGYVNMAFEALHDEFPDAPAIMALPEKQYWSKLAGVFKMAVMIGRLRAVVIAICVLLFIMNISHSYLTKRAGEIRILSYNGIGKSRIFSGMLLEALIVSIAAGIIGGIIATRFSGTAVSLQHATVILKIGRPAIPRGIMLAIILGFLGTMLPAIKTVRMS